jgi:two-component system, chemotaxis family, CheB/CheR fusion protein
MVTKTYPNLEVFMPGEVISRQQKSNTETDQSSLPSFPIVGVGASAGGLNAFKKLLQGLSIDTGMAFVLIQHLDPDHKSLLTELLAKTTKMPVDEVINGIEIAPNHIYIIPPNTKMSLVGNKLKLYPRERTRRGYLPIDLFFESIATECGSKGMGIVLSGSDGDGALGLSAIKMAGGMTFAQDASSSQFRGMPEHAAETGQVDFILPPQEIAAKLNEISQEFKGSTTKSVPKSVPEEAIVAHQSAASPKNNADPLSQLFELLRIYTGIDFTNYKQATIQRRIQRRMSQKSLTKLEDYLTYIHENLVEIDALYQEILITVTSFFRDPEVFQFLEEKILPQLVQQHSSDSPIRVWVPGCATGEEVYSIAICLLESLDGVMPKPPIQIFATDINDQSIAIARAGVYKPSAVENISPERLRRFFIEVNGEYQISKLVRESCIFAKHNLFSDPPFSRLDLISCRNLLIYLGKTLQKKVMQTLHYGLHSSGFLLLGTSETANPTLNLFSPIDKKYKIYAKKPSLAIPNLDFPRIRELSFISSQQPMTDLPATDSDLKQIADEIVLQRHAPAGVIINANLEILQFRGNTSPYLHPAPGKSSFKLMKMVQVDLRAKLRAAIHQAKKLQAPIDCQVEVTDQNLQMNAVDAAARKLISCEVIPLPVTGTVEGYFLILFETTMATVAERSLVQTATRKVKPTLIELENIRLKQELAAIQEQLQILIDEQEAVSQDFRAAGEEILSSNEELQSTNEELETAKEEIQGANEELITVNEELRSRNLQAIQLNNDLINVLSSVQLPILIVGIDLRIGRFTPMAERLFNLISTDVGRSFNDIRHNLNISNLDILILQTIDTLTIYQQDIQDLSGHWYHLTVRPYKTRENQIVGATIVLVDVHELICQEQEIQASRDYAVAIVETIREPLIVLDCNFCVVTANHAFYQMFQLAQHQVEGQLLDTIGNGQWQIPELKSRLEDLLHNNTQFQDFEIEHNFEQMGWKTLLLNGRQIIHVGEQKLLLLAIEDITQRKQLLVEQAARVAAEASNLAKDSFLSMLSHELRNPLSAIIGWSRMLLSGKLTAAQTQQGLEVIDRSATAQNQLIVNLVDLSRINNGKLQLDISPIDLAPIITAAIKTVTLAAEAKNIQIEQQIDPFPEKVLGDPNRIQQILWNLLTNAINFTDPGGHILVRLSLAPTIPSVPMAYAQIQVIDNGRGIAAEFLPHIFDHFRQAESFLPNLDQGLGLGIVHHLVKLHCGTITATSQVEHGSTFTIRLPLANNNSSDMLSTTLTSSPTAAPTTLVDALSLQGLCILVVDDENDVRTIIATILEHYGATVTPISSGSLALQELQANPQAYDVLVSDLGMPEMDGWELIQSIRALDAAEGGHIPAVALTAYNSTKEQRMSLLAGFQVHIAKPVEPEQLVSIIANLVRKRE